MTHINYRITYVCKISPVSRRRLRIKASGRWLLKAKARQLPRDAMFVGEPRRQRPHAVPLRRIALKSCAVKITFIRVFFFSAVCGTRTLMTEEERERERSHILQKQESAVRRGRTYSVVLWGMRTSHLTSSRF